MIDITWSWLNSITKKAKKQPLNISDIKATSVDLDTKRQATMFATEYNKNPTKPILKHFLKVNRNNIMGMFIGIPLLTLSSALAPLCIKQFQSILSPLNLFDCEGTVSNSFDIMTKKSVQGGLKWIFAKLYPYWIILGLGQALRSIADSICSINCVQLGIKITSALLDTLFNKMMLLSETTKNVNAQGSLANILFSDTMKIQFFTKVFYNLFTVPLDLIVAVVYLASYIDPVALIGAAGIFICFPIIGICGDILQKSLNRMATLKDIRSQKIQEILNAVKVIKLFNTEQFQEKRIQNARVQELFYVKKASFAFAGHLTTGFTSYVVMSMIAFGSLIGLEKLDITKSFTMIYLFTFIQVSIGFLPVCIMALQDGIISLKRIQAFLQLSEVDRSFIEVRPEFENAIEIINKHSFAYGLEDDEKISPDLDSSYYMKIDCFKEMKSNKVKLEHIFQQIKQDRVKQNQLEKKLEKKRQTNKDICFALEVQEDIYSLIQTNNFNLTHTICVQACMQFNLPAVTFFMNIKNYMGNYFQAIKQDTQQQILIKQYLHMCVIVYNLKQWELKDIHQTIKPVIKDLELSIKKGELIGIQGPVGSGKSSLFSCILGEMKAIDVKLEKEQLHQIKFDYFEEQNAVKNNADVFIKLGGTIAYCPQNSPIFSSTIRENICFYKSYEEVKYQKIVDICCLQPDFAIFNAGDLTEVGGRGVTLSGGQRARIALARAIYNDADIYLLDDPLSAVDAHVGKRIWNEVIIEYLQQRGKTVLIASHQTHYFKDCNRILTIDNGVVTKIFENIEHVEQSQSHILSDSQSKYDTPKDLPTKQQESGKLTQEETLSGDGNIGSGVYSKFIKAGKSRYFLLYLVLLIVFQGVSQYSSIIISHWANDKYGWTSDSQKPVTPGSELDKILQKAFQDFGTSSYIKSKVQMCYFSINSPPGSRYQVPYSKKYFYVYIALVFIIIITFLLHVLSFFNFSISASAKLYMDQLKAVMRTKLSFFDTTPQGRIINRLVKDTETVDFTFGRFFILMMVQASIIVGMLVSVTALNWPCIIVILPCVIVYMILFSKFRSVTPQLKRLESNSRSSVFTLCQEVLDQLTSIRAYNVQSNFRQQFREITLLNINTQYYSTSTSKWMSFRMTMLGAVMAFLIVGVAMIIAPFSPSLAQYSGIIVSYGYSIQSLMVAVIEMITNTEQEMPAIERMLEYAQLENEETLNNEMIAKNSTCQKLENNIGLDISNLIMKYRPELQPALKGVNIHINPKEHVAIVGRTGSGKSSLAITLFKLYQPEVGNSVQIGDDQISHLPLYDSRRKLAIIPQEPYLFSGTLRQQLCEFTRNKAEGLSTEGIERIPDQKIWELLETVQLSDYIKNQPGGLDCVVVGNGDNFSAGQRQLVCVVRALLRDANVIILDEATAYVDNETDQIIQKIVKEYLRDKIVLSIAHRLDTVLGMDKVLVMDAGKVAEFGTKQELMKIDGGIFRELVIKANIQIPESE
ncbi:Xenobiotic-transporting_ATPase / Multidrug resistance-associated protein [Hexamita inflata]|uniref:Xenobiotic-transporting ATPase / Multidrug resistance-associated protein n=1 Tax=Hexamita inflata TaxID=28002 RepID=A0AA86QZ53_9EUKA|nr:Xenobiotic-transporting ATPase / Multidrug resistance-associated protein [Hexamita inflata]